MRSTRDRIRHTLGFELIGLIIFIPLASSVFGYELQLMGIMVLVASVIATLWNFAYNLAFDRAMLRLFNDTRKSVSIRVVHALLFEVGLIAILLPAIVWYLGVSYWEAFTMDIGMAIFYLVYAFIYNAGYDKIFPIHTDSSIYATERTAIGSGFNSPMI